MRKLVRLLSIISLMVLGAGGVASAQNNSTYGTISAASPTCTPTSCVYYQIPANTPWVVINFTGTWSGSLNVYAINSQTATYQNLNTQTWTLLSTNAVNTNLSVATAGATFLLVNAPTWASGKANVTMS